MPKKLSRGEWEAYLRGRHVCVLGTIGPGGEPVLTPIWYLFDEGKLLMRTGQDSAKAANVRRDSRVTVCVQDERPPYKSVTVYGTASIEPAMPGLDWRIAKHYLGFVGGKAYLRVAAEEIQQSGEVTIVVDPERVTSQDFSAETPAVGRVWLRLKRVLPAAL